MNHLDLNQTGGLPLSTQILAGMQSAYRTTNKFGNIAGNLTIIEGCLESGGVVSDGYVNINGELYFFQGTNVGTHVIIQNVAEPARGFEDGSAKPVIYERYATFGTADEQYAWADFKHPLTLLAIEARLNQLAQMVPIGLVAIWGQPASAIPPGWVEHTDLQGNVPVGHKAGDPNFGALDAVIGVAQVTLTVDQIPSHSHEVKEYAGISAPMTVNHIDAPTTSAAGRRTGFTGGGQSHTNIQPSRIVKFIRFVGFAE